MATYRLTKFKCKNLIDELQNSGVIALNGRVSILWDKLRTYHSNMAMLGTDFVELNEAEVEEMRHPLSVARSGT